MCEYSNIQDHHNLRKMLKHIARNAVTHACTHALTHARTRACTHSYMYIHSKHTHTYQIMNKQTHTNTDTITHIFFISLSLIWTDGWTDRWTVRQTDTHLVGEVSYQVVTAGVVVVDGEAHVPLVVQHKIGGHARYQHVRPDVKLLAIQQQWVCDVPANTNIANAIRD